MSEPYDAHNLLDRLSDPATLEVHYRHMRERERELLARHLPLAGGDVLSVGCGRHPGRHLFPRPAFRLTGVEPDPELVRALREGGELDEAVAARAGELPFLPGSFDVVLYRLVLHHVVYQGPLSPVFEEASRLLRPGGALVAIEPGSRHPVGAALGLANRAGLAAAIHGTPDDVPLSPRLLLAEAEAAGLRAQLHAVTYTWRRMPAALQRAAQPIDRLGSRRRARLFGHTLMLIARRPAVSEGAGARA